MAAPARTTVQHASLVAVLQHAQRDRRDAGCVLLRELLALNHSVKQLATHAGLRVGAAAA